MAVINIQDTGKRTLADSSAVFNQVNGGTAFNISASSVAFNQGLQTDDTPQAGDITSNAGFTNPEIGTASTSAPKLVLAGSIDTTDINIANVKLLAQLSRTRGLIAIYANDDYTMPNFISYSSNNSSSFSAEALVSSSNPMYGRVDRVSIRQAATNPQRLTYTLELLIHSDPE